MAERAWGGDIEPPVPAVASEPAPSKAFASVPEVMDGSRENPIVYFDNAGNGPLYHSCTGGGPVDLMRDWLLKERLLGLSRDEVRLIERMIEDLRP